VTIPRGTVKRGAVCALLALVHAGCGTRAEPAPPTTIRIVDSSILTQALVNAYTQRLPQFDFQVVAGSGPSALTAIGQGEAEIAIVLADSAYFAYASHQGTRELRGLSVIPELPIHLVVRWDKGIRSIADLRKRSIIACGGCTPPRVDEPGIAEYFSGKILKAYGVDPTEVEGGPLPLDKVNEEFRSGKYDAAFINFYYPAPIVTTAVREGAVIFPLEGSAIEHLRLQYPFVREVRIPPGTYPGQSDVIRTIGIDRLLLCRSDLDERVAYTLTKAFAESLQELASVMHMSFRHMDMERAPASPIPLHEGAARYFREWELFR
jgi:TRAP transporter TAXI family solute receptor